MELTIKGLPERSCSQQQLDQIKKCAIAILRGELVKVGGEPLTAPPALPADQPDHKPETDEPVPRPYATAV